jgi:hypothetical protein
MYAFSASLCMAAICPNQIQMCNQYTPILEESKSLSELDLAMLNLSYTQKDIKSGVSTADLILIAVASGLYLLVVIRNTV